MGCGGSRTVEEMTQLRSRRCHASRTSWHGADSWVFGPGLALCMENQSYTLCNFIRDGLSLASCHLRPVVLQ
eukprot:4209262-Amphidinium_carterae.1